MKQFMDWNRKKRKYNKAKNSMEKNIFKGKVSTYIYSDNESDTKEDKAGRPEKQHKTRFPSYIVKDESYKVIIRYFKYLPVF